MQNKHSCKQRNTSNNLSIRAKAFDSRRKLTLNLASVHHRKKSAKIFLVRNFLKQKSPNGGFRKVRLLRLRRDHHTQLRDIQFVIQIKKASAVFSHIKNGLRDRKN